jgi:hypothetical protein
VSRRVALSVLLLSACGGEEDAASPGSGSTAAPVDPSASARAAKATKEEELDFPLQLPLPPRIPKGAPVSVERFSGTFPPKWRVGDTWRVVLLRKEQNHGFVDARAYMDRFEYVFRVTRAPVVPEEGEYRLKVVRRKDVSESYTVSISSKDGCLLRIDRNQKPSPDGPRDVRLAFPIVREPGRFYRYGTLDPVASFPCLPPAPETNPILRETVAPYGVVNGTWSAWQLVEPEEDALRFHLGHVFVPAADAGWPYGTRHEVIML